MLVCGPFKQGRSAEFNKVVFLQFLAWLFTLFYMQCVGETLNE